MKKVNTKYGKQPEDMLPLITKINEITAKLVGHYDAKVLRKLTPNDAGNIVATVLEEVVTHDPNTPLQELIDHLDYIFNGAFFNEVKKNTEKNLAILN
tara:strand:+ start:74 stop:367 length:294 start_codon:yes stop_codon:yes gene_type:complete